MPTAPLTSADDLGFHETLAPDRCNRPSPFSLLSTLLSTCSGPVRPAISPCLQHSLSSLSSSSCLCAAVCRRPSLPRLRDQGVSSGRVFWFPTRQTAPPHCHVSGAISRRVAMLRTTGRVANVQKTHLGNSGAGKRMLQRCLCGIHCKLCSSSFLSAVAQRPLSSVIEDIAPPAGAY